MSTTAMQMTADYTSVSEAPGTRITSEALQMLFTRYSLAASLGAEKDVLEVACGPGHGLGLISQSARRVVGGDLTSEFTRVAARHYGQRVPILRFDAQLLPFADASFDLILLFEAIYYLPDASGFFRECRRVLRRGGAVLVCSSNREWPGFNPSPFRTQYFTARELADCLAAEGYVAELFGAFPSQKAGKLGRVVELIRAIAVRLRLMPKTMAGKEWLKRVFYGKLHELGPEVKEGMAVQAELFPIPPHSASGFKVIYAIGRSQK